MRPVKFLWGQTGWNGTGTLSLWTIGDSALYLKAIKKGLHSMETHSLRGGACCTWAPARETSLTPSLLIPASPFVSISALMYVMYFTVT